MAVPRAAPRSFEINGVIFKRYSASDAHGSKVEHFYVAGEFVDYKTYYRELRAAVQPQGMLQDILYACGAQAIYNPTWT